MVLAIKKLYSSANIFILYISLWVFIWGKAAAEPGWWETVLVTVCYISLPSKLTIVLNMFYWECEIILEAISQTKIKQIQIFHMVTLIYTTNVGNCLL